MNDHASAIGPVLTILNLAGIAVFALTGALAATAKRQTLVTVLFFAVVTAVGGGTFRDLLIGAPVFWIQENATLLICLAAGIAVWIAPARWWSERALLWLDAIGLCAYATYGAAKGLDYGIAPIPAIGMGVVTACLGGIIRDVLAGEPSILMRPELYVTAAALSSALMVLLAVAGLPSAVAGLIAAVAGFGLRAGAIRNRWSLPAYDR